MVALLSKRRQLVKQPLLGHHRLGQASNSPLFRQGRERKLERSQRFPRQPRRNAAVQLGAESALRDGEIDKGSEIMAVEPIAGRSDDQEI